MLLALGRESTARSWLEWAVRHRMRLRDLDPEIFAGYMARLEG